MSMILNDEFQKMDEEYGDQMEKMFGPTLLGFPEGVDSSRLYMFTSNLKQILNLLNPDVPHILTGYENEFGKRSKGYKRMDGEWRVEQIIRKFETKDIYTIVLYNELTDTYDMIEKKIAEDLTEKFGFVYDNRKMDSLEVGDVIKDEVIYKTPSYDEHMNYRIGKNALVMYTTDTSTIEDAIMLRKGWADQVKSVEIDTVQVPVNDNDVLLNICGNDEEYKTFPDIGEQVNGCTVCAVRRINNQHILYDFQIKNMQEIYSTDTEYVVSKGAEIYDIDIYYNNDKPFPDNIFYHQAKKYYDMICIYADNVLEACNRIKQSGSNYTKNVNFLRSKYKHYTDREYQWKNHDRVFSNLVIEFTTRTVVSLQEGFKLTGRYGDKGVISKIANQNQNMANEFMHSIMDTLGRNDLSSEEIQNMANDIEFKEDSEMPYLEDGRQVDILLNASGAIRRLNTDQLYEVEINFCSHYIQEKIKTLPTLEEKAEMAFKYLRMLNSEEEAFFFRRYTEGDQSIKVGAHTVRLMNRKQKEEFIRDIEENGFFIIKSPDSKIRYTTLKSIYEEFPFIKPYTAYIDRFGIKGKKIMKPIVVGSKYMYLLKQTSNKNFSARSTGRLDKKGLPAKSNDKRDNLTTHSKTPIKIGEAHNMFSAISGSLLAEYNIFMRSSPIGRKSLSRIVSATDDPFNIKKIKIKNNYLNVNAQILNANLKAIGLRLHFESKDPYAIMVENGYKQRMDIGGYQIYDYPANKPIYVYLFDLFKELASVYDVVETRPNEKKHIIWDAIFKRPEVIRMQIPDSVKEILCEDLRSSEAELQDDKSETAELIRK